MSNMLLRHADNRLKDSFATKLRRKRFELFTMLLDSLKKDKIEILDLGGTVLFWENMGFEELRKGRDIRITVLNIMPQDSEYEFIKTIKGDARDLSGFADKQFDIVFSNSVIEHVGSYDDQKRMALEVQRVGKNYFIQTPNRYFPVEPHFLFPFFQFLPLTVKVFLLQHCKLSWYKNIKSKGEAEQAAREIRLLCLKEFKEFFPGADIYKEKLLGLTKSFIAYRFR